MTENVHPDPAVLCVEPLSAETFAAFGDVLEIGNSEAQLINQGHTKKFANLAQVDAAEHGGQPAIHLYRSQPLSLPLKIDVMERHPLASQAFMPLHSRPFLVIVAPPGDRVDSKQVRAFLTNGKQGINLHRGTWHHYQVSLEQVSDYLVIDREGPGDNIDEQWLSPPLMIKNLMV